MWWEKKSDPSIFDLKNESVVDEEPLALQRVVKL